MKATKFNKTSIIRIGITILFLLTTSFCSQKNMVEKSESDTNLLFGLLAGQLTVTGQQQESGKDFILNGQWDSFTGNGTTKDTILTITAKFGSIGITLTDAHDLFILRNNS
jgi:spore maturation protein CgeB